MDQEPYKVVGRIVSLVRDDDGGIVGEVEVGSIAIYLGAHPSVAAAIAAALASEPTAADDRASGG